MLYEMNKGSPNLFGEKYSDQINLVNHKIRELKKQYHAEKLFQYRQTKFSSQ